MRWFPDPEGRSTVDLVILLMGAVVGFVIVMSLIGLLLIELIHPESDTTDLIRMESEILGVLVGALVGVISGRAIGRAESLTSGTQSSEQLSSSSS